MKVWATEHKACKEALVWIGDKSAKEAWETCTRLDWMFWCLARTSVERKVLVELACDFALSVQHLNPDPRVMRAIEAAQGWCNGTRTVQQCSYAADAARAAADAADAADAAHAAAHAADAAHAAAHAAATRYAAATYAAADAARDAAAAYAYDAARDACDLIRARISGDDFAKLIAM